MIQKTISLKYKNKDFNISLRICESLCKMKGLMFSNKEKSQALLFKFTRPTKRAIHSLFVFFPFVAVWLDDKNKIIELKIVKPFTFLVLPKKPFNKLIEIPVNKRYKKIITLLIGG